MIYMKLRTQPKRYFPHGEMIELCGDDNYAIARYLDFTYGDAAAPVIVEKQRIESVHIIKNARAKRLKRKK